MSEYWQDKHYAFFQNKECEFFPCHETTHPESFNCLFCYCPLYALGKNCGGNFKITESGVKDCSACRVPHEKANYGKIVSKVSEIIKMTKE